MLLFLPKKYHFAQQFFRTQYVKIWKILCVSGLAHITTARSGGMMSTAGLELPYLRVSQAKFPDETAWRGK